MTRVRSPWISSHSIGGEKNSGGEENWSKEKGGFTGSETWEDINRRR